MYSSAEDAKDINLTMENASNVDEVATEEGTANKFLEMRSSSELRAAYTHEGVEKMNFDFSKVCQHPIIHGMISMGVELVHHAKAI